MDLYSVKYSINHFKISFNEEAKLNKSKESAIRGIVGQALIAEHCISDKDCLECYFKDRCIASSFLNMRLEYDLYFSSSKYLPPFVVICDNDETEIQKNGELLFSIIFFSKSITLIPEIIRAVRFAGSNLGLSNNKFQLQEVFNDRNEDIYIENKINLKKIKYRLLSAYIENRLSISDEINVIKIVNPVRYKKNGKLSSNIDDNDIIDLLKRRVLSLNALEGNKVEADYEFKLKILDKSVHWVENKRYSNRQQDSMKFGGIVGEVKIKVEDLETKKLLIAGELVHIGKNTSFGLGDYILY